MWKILKNQRFTVYSAKKLRPYLVHSKDVDQNAANELYNFWKQHVKGDTRYENFHHFFDCKYTVIFRDNLSGHIRGMTFYDIQRNIIEYQNKPFYFTIIKGEAGYIHCEYQGQSAFYDIFLAILLKEKICHPLTPLYLGGKLHSYKLYLITIMLFKKTYPQYNRITPDLERSVIDHFATTKLKPGQVYNQNKGIININISVKEDVAPITEKELSNPHITFYSRIANPEWEKGNALVAVAKITWTDIVLRVIPVSIQRKLRQFV